MPDLRPHVERDRETEELVRDPLSMGATRADLVVAVLATVAGVAELLGVPPRTVQWDAAQKIATEALFAGWKGKL